MKRAQNSDLTAARALTEPTGISRGVRLMPNLSMPNDAQTPGAALQSLRGAWREATPDDRREITQQAHAVQIVDDILFDLDDDADLHDEDDDVRGEQLRMTA